jgi:hypothetical protein
VLALRPAGGFNNDLSWSEKSEIADLVVGIKWRALLPDALPVRVDCKVILAR